MAKKKVPISYTARDFNSIKAGLVEHARRYYPDSYKDFTEASFGSLLLDSVAYVGDVLSYYVDYQVNESFLDTAVEKQNVISHARSMGYEYTEAITSYGICEFFITVPINTLTRTPDENYIPILRKGSQFASSDGGQYTLIDDVDFSSPENETIVATVDGASGAPTEYAIKALGQVKSGFEEELSVPVGPYERFKKVILDVENASEVVSVTDSEGHRYYEVDHLSQDVIYVDLSNRNKDSNYVRNIIKPQSVPRRYVANFFQNGVQLQFGQGSDEHILSSSYEDPSKVVLNQFGKEYISDNHVDPTNLTTSTKMGVSPSNTTLTVLVRRDDRSVTNAAVGSIDAAVNSVFTFADETKLTEAKRSGVVQSIEVYNPEQILGDLEVPTVDEVIERAKNQFAAQNRAVTMQDYKSVAYSMPAKFGAIKRCTVAVDKDSFKRNINLHVVSENLEGNLIESNLTLKNNLRTWIDHYRMMGDTFDILDARRINLGINYSIITDKSYSSAESLAICNREVSEYFKTHPEIGEALFLNDIYKLLGNLDFVIDVTDVEVVNLSGAGYSSLFYEIQENLSMDGRTLTLPFDYIYEVKYPNSDIQGTVL
jgi:hypothetical protein